MERIAVHHAPAAMLLPTPPPCRFIRSVTLDAPIEAVFRFHQDPHNISVISPPFQSARVLRAGREARVGEEFEFEVKLLGLLRLRWLGRWREVQAPGLLADEALRSPFAEFIHHHRFEPAGDAPATGRRQTRMTDEVTYRFPGGWLGKIFGETFGRAQFVVMFADRHRRTRRWAAELSATAAAAATPTQSTSSSNT